MSVFDVLTRHGTMELHVFHDAPTGLRAMVALHDTRLGPAIGGTRVFPYPTEDDAVLDVVRLARAMTAKAALAGLPHGGGKAVIWANSRQIQDRVALFRAYGRFVDALGGRYLAAEDSGTSPQDMDVIRQMTRFCLGSSIERGGSGDPSPFTALGVRRGIEACAEVILGKEMKGLRVAIQGVGHVGMRLARELHAAGCQLTIADVDEVRARQAVDETGAAMVDIESIFDVDCDVLAPCALGGAITESTVERLRCRVVAGAANNQLATREVGEWLHGRGIFYAPDYAINAGGLINVALEWKGYDASVARAKTLAIKDTIAELARRSQKTGQPPAEIADRMVEEVLARAEKAQPLPATLLASPAPEASAPLRTTRA